MPVPGDLGCPCTCAACIQALHGPHPTAQGAQGFAPTLMGRCEPQHALQGAPTSKSAILTGLPSNKVSYSGLTRNHLKLTDFILNMSVHFAIYCTSVVKILPLPTYTNMRVKQKLQEDPAS